jgi:hypothetical protein
VSRAAWCLLLFLPWFLLPALGRDQQPTRTAPLDEMALTFSPKEQADIKLAVEAVLPPRWAVTRTQIGSAPTDWFSDDPRAGFLVECSDGDDSARIWFLPRDWIGIRKVPNQAALTCYWEGVLAGDKYKTITHAPDGVQQALSHLGGNSMGTPSLINGGYYQAECIFRGKFQSADASALRLIRKNCTTPPAFEEAALSLVVLGVPAESVFRRAAREVKGSNKDLFCSALGEMGGDEAIGVLCEVLSDSTVDAYQRGYAAMALQRHEDERIGPALHKAL